MKDYGPNYIMGTVVKGCWLCDVGAEVSRAGVACTRPRIKDVLVSVQPRPPARSTLVV